MPPITSLQPKPCIASLMLKALGISVILGGFRSEGLARKSGGRCMYGWGISSLPVIDKLTVHYVAPFQHSHINKIDSSCEIEEREQIYRQTFHVRFAFIIDNSLNVLFGYGSLGCLLIYL